MAIDVSALVGSAQVAATQVSPRGFGNKAMKGYVGMYVGGGVGAAISAHGLQKAGKQKAEWAAESQTLEVPMVSKGKAKNLVGVLGE